MHRKKEMTMMMKQKKQKKKKATNQSRIKLVRLFKVEEIRLASTRTVRWLLHSWCEVAASFGQKARTRECAVPSRPAPTRWEWQETDASTRVKWSRRRVQLQEIGEKSRSGRGNNVETEACNYRKFERRRATSGADQISVCMWCVRL